MGLSETAAADHKQHQSAADNERRSDSIPSNQRYYCEVQQPYVTYRVTGTDAQTAVPVPTV